MTNNNNNDKGFNVEMNSIPPPSLPPPSMTMMTGIVGGDSMKIINRSIQQQTQSQQQQPPPAYKRNQMMTKRIIWGKEIPHIVQHNHHHNHHLNHHNHHHLSSSTNNNNNTGNNTQTFDNYVMILGSNPLITIRPINIRDEMATSSTSSYGDPYTSRVFEMDNLRNYFQLNEPESSTTSTNHHSSSSSSSISSISASTTNPIRFRYEYFLSLLDPTMPRLTNCGNYYRMRYAVYVAIKNSDSFGGGGGGGIGGGNIDFNSITNDWRNKQYQQQKVSQQSSSSLSSSKRKLVHIGEIHLYTIVPESIVSIGRRYYNNQHSIDYHSNSNSTTTSILPSIHYENISFFSSQIPLSREELQVLQLSNNNNSISNNNNGTTNGQSDFTSIVNHFRSFLKYLNTIIVTVSDENHHINNNNNGGSGGKQSYRSTCLLEQLKYPKIIEQFINPDRIFHQFNRIQCTMLTKYLSQQQQQQFQPLQPLDVVTASAASTLSLSSSVVEKQLQLNGTKTSTSTNEPDIITEEIFVQNLIQLMPTSSTSS